MTDALTRAFADAERMVVNCKSAAPSISTVVAASAGYTMRPPSLMVAQEQLLHLRDYTWSAIRLIAQRVCSQRVCVGFAPTGRRFKRFKRLKSSSGQRIEPLDSHPLLDTMANPNPWWTYWQLMFASICSLEVTGRTLWWLRKQDGQTQILFIPTPWIYEIDPLRAWYRIRPVYSASAEFDIPGEECVELHYPSPDGGLPTEVLSPLQRVCEAVKSDQQIQIAQSAAIRNGIYPSVILTAGKLPGANGQPGERPTFTPQQREDLVTAIRQRFAGVTSMGEPLILDSLIERIDRLNQSAVELDFSNSSKIIKGRVLEAYGVSEVLMGCVSNANRATSVTADEIFVFNKINPLLELLSGVFTQRMAPLFASGRRRLQVWIEPARPHDAELFQKEWDSASRLGFVTKNEYRINVLNIPAVPGGDTYLEPAGFLPSNEADDETDTTDTTDDATDKSVKRLGHKDDDDECDEIEDGVCPDCGGTLDDSDICQQCGADFSDADCDDKGHVSRNNGQVNRLTAS